jgi:hypothetical protein
VKTIQVEAYEFHELDDKAKEAARDWCRELNNDCGDSVSDVRDDFENTLSEIGLGELKAWWSLSYCQGDGVAFDGQVDLDAFIAEQPAIRMNTEKWPKAAERYTEFLIDEEFCKDVIGLAAQGVQIGAYVKHEGRYTHRNSMDVTFQILSAGDNEDPGASERQEKKVKELEEQFHEYIKNLSIQFEHDGYAIIEGNETNEHIDEEIKANGWLFTKSGGREATLPTVEEVPA